jgi:hypothetical protein
MSLDTVRRRVWEILAIARPGARPPQLGVPRPEPKGMVRKETWFHQTTGGYTG